MGQSPGAGSAPPGLIQIERMSAGKSWISQQLWADLPISHEPELA